MPDLVSIPPSSGRPWPRRRALATSIRRDHRARSLREPVQLEFPFREPSRPRDAAAHYAANLAQRKRHPWDRWQDEQENS